MPMYFDKNFSIGPERSAGYLSVEKFAGIGAAYLLRFVERAVLQREGTSLLSARRLFAGVGFTLNALSVLGLAWLCRFRAHPMAPAATSVLLCLNSVGLSAHSFGFKPNYLDITARFSGAFMGVGNTCATAMTYIVPLAAAYMVEAAGGDWSGLFICVAILNVGGGVVGVCLTSTERLDERLGATAKIEGGLAASGSLLGGRCRARAPAVASPRLSGRAPARSACPPPRAPRPARSAHCHPCPPPTLRPTTSRRGEQAEAGAPLRAASAVLGAQTVEGALAGPENYPMRQCSNCTGWRSTAVRGSAPPLRPLRLSGTVWRRADTSRACAQEVFEPLPRSPQVFSARQLLCKPSSTPAMPRFAGLIPPQSSLCARKPKVGEDYRASLPELWYEDNRASHFARRPFVTSELRGDIWTVLLFAMASVFPSSRAS
ncbi:unnamed protein product [Prorocentrum cordatum]|uniref:Solute carrier family 40 protein n=1 Tax=Prorocentrum cordatum TaxID=2364126 RepID=A0ABN9THZ0_9DINO|nr:unnamed protein product [Polarella glacialis]